MITNDANKDNTVRTHCNEHNYDRISKYITSDDIGGSVEFEYEIIKEFPNSYNSTKGWVIVFCFNYGSDVDNLNKIARFMKLLGEDHV